MQAVLISIQPQWCKLIAKGMKTIEIRKTRPNIDTPFKCYIYCTKPPRGASHKYDAFGLGGNPYEYGGKVIGEFTCKNIRHYRYTKPFIYYGKRMFHTNEGCPQACLTWEELENYLGENDGFGWCIDDLIIYEKPKELYEFINYGKHEVCLQKNCFSGSCWQCQNNAIMVRPPQSWCYVKE